MIALKFQETHSNNILTIKEAAKQAFLEQIRVKKQHMEENVAFLQQRIHSLQDDYLQYEKKVNAEMDICLRWEYHGLVIIIIIIIIIIDI